MPRWLSTILAPFRSRRTLLALDAPPSVPQPPSPRKAASVSFAEQPNSDSYQPATQNHSDPFERATTGVVGWIRGGVSSRAGDWR
jgi:hypothetical protein